jgi:hypothetical protein
MKSAKNIDWVASKTIADAVDARVDECLANVVRAFLDYRSILPKDAVHVEGIYAYGGQFSLHTWIETLDSIIELALVRDTNKVLRESVQHFPILVRGETEIRELYGDKPRVPGVRLIMELDYDDPEVIRLLNKVDTPPGLRSI